MIQDSECLKQCIVPEVGKGAPLPYVEGGFESLWELIKSILDKENKGSVECKEPYIREFDID